jgi:hypothetical protein
MLQYLTLQYNINKGKFTHHFYSHYRQVSFVSDDASVTNNHNYESCQLYLYTLHRGGKHLLYNYPSDSANEK